MSVRLCLCVETTSRHCEQWQDIRESLVEPILRALDARRDVDHEFSLVLFGAPKYSAAEVESSDWADTPSALRQWLDLIDFAGGGGQPISLAAALAEAAALFALPTPLAVRGAARHCLVCSVSEPSKAAVGWPWPEDCMHLTDVPDCASGAELCCAFGRLGISLGLLTRREKQLASAHAVWLLCNALSGKPVPASAAGLRDMPQVGTRILSSHVSTARGSVGFLPFWERMLEELWGAHGRPAAAARKEGAAEAEKKAGEGSAAAGRPALETGAPAPGSANLGAFGSLALGSTSMGSAPLASGQLGSAALAPGLSQSMNMSGLASAALTLPAPLSATGEAGAGGAAWPATASGMDQEVISMSLGAADEGLGSGLRPSPPPGSFWDVMAAEIGLEDATAGRAAPGANPQTFPPPPASAAQRQAPPEAWNASSPSYASALSPSGARPPSARPAPQPAAAPPPGAQSYISASPSPPPSSSGPGGGRLGGSNPSAPGTHAVPSMASLTSHPAATLQPALSPPAQSRELTPPGSTASGASAASGALPSRPPPVRSVRVWQGELRLSERVAGSSPQLLGAVSAWAPADLSVPAKLMRETLLVDRFVMDSEKVAAAVQSPGTVQLRLLPEDWGPDSEKVLRRLVDARAHGQLEWGSKHSAFLLLNARAGRVVMTLVIARK